MAASLELWAFDGIDTWSPVEKDPGTYALTLIGVRIEEGGDFSLIATPQLEGHMHDVYPDWPADPE